MRFVVLLFVCCCVVFVRTTIADEAASASEASASTTGSSNKKQAAEPAVPRPPPLQTASVALVPKDKAAVATESSQADEAPQPEAIKSPQQQAVIPSPASNRAAGTSSSSAGSENNSPARVTQENADASSASGPTPLPPAPTLAKGDESDEGDAAAKIAKAGAKNAAAERREATTEAPHSVQGSQRPTEKTPPPHAQAPVLDEESKDGEATTKPANTKQRSDNKVVKHSDKENEGENSENEKAEVVVRQGRQPQKTREESAGSGQQQSVVDESTYRFVEPPMSTEMKVFQASAYTFVVCVVLTLAHRGLDAAGIDRAVFLRLADGPSKSMMVVRGLVTAIATLSSVVSTVVMFIFGLLVARCQGSRKHTASAAVPPVIIATTQPSADLSKMKKAAPSSGSRAKPPANTSSSWQDTWSDDDDVSARATTHRK